MYDIKKQSTAENDSAIKTVVFVLHRGDTKWKWNFDNICLWTANLVNFLSTLGTWNATAAVIVHCMLILHNLYLKVKANKQWDLYAYLDPWSHIVWMLYRWQCLFHVFIIMGIGWGGVGTSYKVALLYPHLFYCPDNEIWGALALAGTPRLPYRTQIDKQ